jgi:hypothetical protein
MISCRNLLEHEVKLNSMIMDLDLTKVRNKEKEFKREVTDLINDYGNLKKDELSEIKKIGKIL